MPTVTLVSQQSNGSQQRFVTMTTDANSHPAGPEGGVHKDIKRDLQQRIKQKYQQQGLDIQPEYKPQVTYELTPEEMEKKDRRRKQNRVAAHRCRLKKKKEESQIHKDYDRQKKIYKQYGIEIHRLSKEIQHLQYQLENHSCCLWNSAETVQGANSSAQKLQGIVVETGTPDLGKQGSFPVFHPSSSLGADEDDEDMTSLEDSWQEGGEESCGWASSVNESMDLGGEAEGSNPQPCLRSGSTGFQMTHQHDSPLAHPDHVDDNDLFGPGSPRPGSSSSLPPGPKRSFRACSTVLDQSGHKAWTAGEGLQRHKMKGDEGSAALSPKAGGFPPGVANVPTMVAQLAAEEAPPVSTGQQAAPLVPAGLIPGGSIPVLPRAPHIDSDSMNLPELSSLQSMELHPPFDLESYQSMKCLIPQSPSTDAIPNFLSLPLLPGGTASSPQSVLPSLHSLPIDARASGLQTGCPTFPPAATAATETSFPSASMTGPAPCNNGKNTTEHRINDDSVWTQSASPQVFLGSCPSSSAELQPVLPPRDAADTQSSLTAGLTELPSDIERQIICSGEFQQDMFMTSDAGREECRSPTAPSTPGTSQLFRVSGPDEARASRLVIANLSQKEMLNHGFSPNSAASWVGSEVSRGKTVRGPTANSYPGGIPNGFNFAQLSPSESQEPVPELPLQDAAVIHKSLTEGNIELPSDGELRKLNDDLTTEIKALVYAWDRQQGMSGRMAGRQPGAGHQP